MMIKSLVGWCKTVIAKLRSSMYLLFNCSSVNAFFDLFLTVNIGCYICLHSDQSDIYSVFHINGKSHVSNFMVKIIHILFVY